MRELLLDIESRMEHAERRYGPFASTHEGLGVALEEWDELKDAIRANALASVEHECLDLSAVLIRLAIMIRASGYNHDRSVK
jgi:NTP pyrophosphatase (non-canonical NTP hydrolase)